jgi:uncharacterized protein (TIGR00369 family)
MNLPQKDRTMSRTETLARPASPLPLEEIAGLSGLEVMQRLLSGALPPPPFAITTGILPIEVEEGRVVFEGRPSAAFLNPLGSIHGGWVAAILDSAMGCAVHARLAAGQTYTTIEMKINLVRAVSPKMSRVRCEGRVLHFGGRIATSEGDLRDVETGALLAHGTETCLIMDMRK